eukprot:CAMPEP_0185579396 /NCGR_PEP_ID=MMETSP0434-20130131/14635_1 /TAXON_ID=626734 ORGANISM="Favella taraikaensis, Strain Fe Narragansett Bay" /NCGR_SAMPLE_ID=MMETSP0434 /ASSEMBLY_ACC=CAM_ASM_000379 /LENGTH=55 /DNA_ID=CAMNT_0028197411 /DNA_START=581 /DNA_END=748 /DNA_ORIENTATION=+
MTAICFFASLFFLVLRPVQADQSLATPFKAAEGGEVEEVEEEEEEDEDDAPKSAK